MEQFQISPRLQAYLKTWPSRVTADVPEIQDFVDATWPSPREGTANKSISIYYSKSDGTLFQVFVADSLLDNDMQVSEF